MTEKQIQAAQRLMNSNDCPSTVDEFSSGLRRIAVQRDPLLSRILRVYAAIVAAVARR